MMKKGCVFLIIVLQTILSGLKVGEENMKIEQNENNFCDISEFADLDYYLFCDTTIITGPSDLETRYMILGNDVCTIEDGEQLYQKFQERYTLNKERENSYILYISPDCRWVITKEDVSEEYDDYMARWRVFYEEKKIMETDEESSATIAPIIVVKSGEAYAVMEKQMNTKLMVLADELYSKEYDPNPVINEQGDLAAVTGMWKNDKLVSIWNIYDGMEIWSFSIENIQADKPLRREILQFWGDENEGKVIMRIGDRDFYEVSYPSGDMKYIGKDIYSLCYSPDRKYAAYSNCDHDDYYDFDTKDFNEVKTMPEGIYILEIETGRTAYIEQDSELNYQCRNFQWGEKKSFNNMKIEAIQMEEKP